MTEFLTHMPTDTKIFLAMAVLGFGGNAVSAEIADLAAGTPAHVVLVGGAPGVLRL